MGAPVEQRRRRAADRTPSRLGALMYESHASYSACGLGSDGTDRLVALAREAGPARGIYGAKITGGGSGGTVAILARRVGRRDVSAPSRASTPPKPAATRIVFEGTSPGAAAIGGDSARAGVIR